MSKDANKENEGSGTAANANPSLNKNTTIFATDMTGEMRQSIVELAQRAFHAPVNQGKVYQTIADLIRTECEKECDGGAGSGGGGDGSKGGSESSGGAQQTGKTLGSGGWSCVVGDAFGSSVTHRMKTYIHFSVVPGVNVLLWKS